MIRGDLDNQVRKVMQIAFVTVMMPTFIAIAWWKAPGFDPYTMSFFTKTYIEPTPDMPGELRISGWGFIGIAALLGYVVIAGIRKQVHGLRDTLMLALMGLEITAFGGAFFLAADAAQARIEQEKMP